MIKDTSSYTTRGINFERGVDGQDASREFEDNGVPSGVWRLEDASINQVG